MDKSDKLTKFARAGYLTRGVIYLIIGWLAVEAAIAGGESGKTTGAKGALLEVLGKPFGQTMLALLALGLVGYALWRFTESILDADSHGTDAKGLVIRGGLLVSGGTHLLLAFFATRLILGTGGGAGGGDWTAELLGTGWGRWVVGLIGLAIVGAGIAQGAKALKGKFKQRLQIDRQKLRWVSPVCIFGLVSRGVVFVIIGSFFISAALQQSSAQSKGMKEALITLQQQPYGQILFAVVAFGLIAFAVYSMVEARYRRIGAPKTPV